MEFDSISDTSSTKSGDVQSTGSSQLPLPSEPMPEPNVTRLMGECAPSDRPHTISAVYQHSYCRPSLTPDTYQPPMSSQLPDRMQTQSMPSALNPYAVPTVVIARPKLGPSQSVRVADIYARPLLVAGVKDSRCSYSLAVSTPTVPERSVLVTATDEMENFKSKRFFMCLYWANINICPSDSLYGREFDSSKDFELWCLAI